MPSDPDDDYLSDKFLIDTATSSPAKPTTYSQRRKEEKKKSAIRNEQGRTKSRWQRELESREEGLGKSLFERAKEEADAGLGGGSKALSMMMKMGFKPGQALGKQVSEPTDETASDLLLPDGPILPKHKTEPLPINEWTGKKGIGLGKRPRAPSPTSAERVAKMTKMAEESCHDDFRDRAQQEYKERRAEGRLPSAQRTCVSLDEENGIEFNTLWLNPKDPGTFPENLLDALSDSLPTLIGDAIENRVTVVARLRAQMQADRLQPLTETESGLKTIRDWPPEVLTEAAQFLSLSAQNRLSLVLSHLRDRYSYCFWCGIRYETEAELEDQCPGTQEDDHD